VHCAAEKFTMMSVEPGIVDTNVLVYGLDADAQQHTAARALLEAGRNGSATLYVTLQILCEFYSIVTNARRVAKPRDSAEALSALSDLLAFLHVLPVPAHTVEGLMKMLGRHPVTGADVFDLQIVATMQANSIQRIYTFNTDDFKAFTDLTIVMP
jgi:predicted nucleic acid-binding protein